MNAAAGSLVLRRNHAHAIDTDVAPFRIYVYAACTAAAVALNYFFGKEMASDTLHYHLYAGFSALNDRFDQDYFAAGPQSYFSPYAYLPFYLLIKLGLPGLGVGTVLAVLHSAVLWITYELACTIGSERDRRQRFFFGVCVTTMALMNPILLQQVGSAFADITTAVLVLGGWLLIAQSIRTPSPARVIFAGILLGCATAFKGTNAIHALASLLTVLFVPLPLFARIRSLLYFCASLAVSFLLSAAPWSYRLVRVFGNPMFPLFNHVFKSPEFTTAPLLKHYRFIPDTLGDALLRPLAIASRTEMIHSELTAPDIRYLMLLIVFVLIVVARIGQSTANVSRASITDASRSTTRILVAVGCGFTVDWIMWLEGSGNGRYFLPMASVAAVIAMALLFRLLVNYRASRNALLITLFVAQAYQLCLAKEYRWNAAPRDGRWFNITVPEKLATKPNLYLSIGMQSNSFVLPFLAEGSGFANISGGYALGPNGANADHLQTMIKKRGTQVRVIVAGEKIYLDEARLEPRLSDIDDVLRAYRLRADMDDCETITVRGLRRETWRALDSSIPPPPRAAPNSRYVSYLTSCHVVADSGDRAEDNSARQAVDLVLDRIEDACPKLFQPPRPQTQHENHVWFRFYPLTDLTAWVSNGEIKFVDPSRPIGPVIIGREEEWSKVPLSLNCGRRQGVSFAKAVPSQTVLTLQ